MNGRRGKVTFKALFSSIYLPPSAEIVSQFPKTDILYVQTPLPSSSLVDSCPTTLSRLTHGPAYQIFDRTNQQDYVGCEALRARLSHLRPRLHLAGHIHEARGAYIHAWDNTAEPPSIQASHGIYDDNIQDPNLAHTVFVNAANWPSGERIRREMGIVKFGGPGFQPVVVDLKD